MADLRKKALEHAVGLFFDAVADPAQWPAAIDVLARAMDAEGGLVFSTDKDLPFLGGSSPLSGMMDAYVRDNWHPLNPRVMPEPFRVFDGFIADHDLLAGRDFSRDPYYQDFLKQQGLMWGAGTRLWLTDDQQPVLLTLERSSAAGQFSPTDLADLGQVRTDLVRALTVTRTLGFRRLDAMLIAWETIDKAMALLDATGRLIRATRTFSAAIGDGLTLRDNRLAAADDQDAAALVASLRGALRPLTSKQTAQSTSLVIRRPSRRPPLVLDILPVPENWETTLIGARVLVHLRDPARVVPARADLLRSAFSFSPREAELATLLTRGLDLSEAAEALGVTRPTVRSQLAALFNKTGTHRQAELVALLNRYAGAVEQDARDSLARADDRADRSDPI